MLHQYNEILSVNSQVQSSAYSRLSVRAVYIVILEKSKQIQIRDVLDFMGCRDPVDSASFFF